MRFQFWNMSEDSRVGILLGDSSVQVCLVVLNQGYCGSGQYNIPDRMLWLDAYTTLIQSYVLFITLVNITYHSKISISHLSIPGIVAHGRCYISHFFKYFFSFLPAVVLNCLSCSACILQMHNKPNQSLIQIKVYFFSNLWFCPSVKSLLLLL